MLKSFRDVGVTDRDIEIKVFGGADTLQSKTSNSIGSQNIKVTLDTLSKERLGVIAADVGDNFGRKLIFLSHTGEVFLKRLRKAPTPLRNMGRKIKVLIVDDSAVVRSTLSDILSSASQIEIMATASDPFIAAETMCHEIPDVISLDIEMPRMDGLTFLHKIMSQHPIPVVVCSSLAEAGAETTIKALELGAVEIILKPRLGAKQFLEESRVRICDAVRAAAMAKVKRLPEKTYRPSPKLTADAGIAKPTGMSMIQTTEKSKKAIAS